MNLNIVIVLEIVHGYNNKRLGLRIVHVQSPKTLQNESSKQASSKIEQQNVLSICPHSYKRILSVWANGPNQS